jgi:hypothetical protein
MRLAFLAFYAFCELVESITCVFSMGPLGPNPTLTVIYLKINNLTVICRRLRVFESGVSY